MAQQKTTMFGLPKGSAFDDWHKPVRRSVWAPVIFGLTVLVGLVASFGLWASTAPLASATVAQGAFVATGTNKTIQHLEGGIIRNILVQEGDQVEAGQALVHLDSEQVRVELRRLSLQHQTLIATLARLRAEQSDAERLEFPSQLEQVDIASFPELAGIFESQQRVFNTRRDKYRSEVKIMSRRISAIEEEIGGLEAQKKANAAQLELIDDELTMNEGLMEKGLARLPALLQLRRTKAKIEGDVGQLIANIGQARQRILETEAEILNIKSRRAQEIADEHRDSQAKLDDASERLKSAQDIQNRLTVTAPVRGIVIKLYHHTQGGVIAPGEKIMDVLPTDEKLLVEALIRPQDKDAVRLGLDADTRLSALNQRTTPVLSGKVVYVSADTIEGKQPGEIYYVARVAIPDSEFERVKDQNVSPGMPAEVYIKTGARTLAEYIARPLTDSFNRAFREN